MINLDIVSQNTAYQEGEYYNYRKLLHSIYDKDVWYGDLVGAVLAFRDQNKYVETISIDIKAYQIYVVLRKDTDQNEQSKIVNGITQAIIDFINTSSRLLSDSDRDLVQKFINSSWPICEYYNIGTDEIQFVL